MRKSISKKVLTAAILGMVCLYGVTPGNVVFAEAVPQTSVAVNVQIRQQDKACIDWTKGADSDMTVLGIGQAPDGAGSNGAALARRAAIVDAYRNLAEMIEGVQVDSETVMHDCMIRDDNVRTRVNALVKGARILAEGSDGEGRYFVKMSLPLYGKGSSLAAVAIPAVRPSAVEPFPTASGTRLPDREVKAVRKAAYTGVIVDASGLGLESTFSPVIYDADGRGVYGIRNIDPDYAISQGMVEYATNLDSAIAKSRAGSNPLVVKALAVQGGRNSANRVNVVVSAEDGDKILLANEASGMLQNCAVVFVK